VPPGLDEVNAGADTPIAFTVRNYGGRVRYRMTATTVGAQFLTGIAPSVLDFATNGEQRVTVLVPARTIAAAGSIELMVVAESEDKNRRSWNSAILRLGIVKR